jgi:proteasome lid subunit RPN8/RPN11
MKQSKKNKIVENKNVIVKTTEVGTIGKIVITKELQKIIDYLHSTIGSIEWSGILFYQLTKGNLNTLRDLEFSAKFLYPMNVGSSAYTEFEYSGEVMNAYDVYPEGIENSTGLIHTHHNMGAFFSGTDISELSENCKHFNYYISLVVDFKKTYKCKVFFPSMTTTIQKSTFKGKSGEPLTVNIKKEEEVILIGDLDISFEEEVIPESWLVERVTTLQKPKPVAKNFNFTPFPHTSNEKLKRSSVGLYDYSNKGIYDDCGDYDTFYDNLKKSSNITGSEFLSALILLDADSNQYTAEQAIVAVENDKDFDLKLYLNAFDLNIEIVHQSLFKESDNITKHCIEALDTLVSIEDKDILKSDLYKGIKEILKAYAL